MGKGKWFRSEDSRDDKVLILKVLVGSHAHGLADKESDRDYRGVYVLPTSKILSLGYRYKANDWVEGDEDNTAYEVGHFLMLATKCNPTTLEVFKAPIIYATEEGERLRYLFKHAWNAHDSFNAFIGYGLNQRKKFLDKKDRRPNKFACAYIRTLANLIELLTTGDFSVEIKEQKFKDDLLRYKKGDYKTGEVIDHAETLTAVAIHALNASPFKDKQTEIEPINNVLLEIRRRFWDINDDGKSIA